MSKIVYAEWLNEIRSPEIVGVFENDQEAYDVRSAKESSLQEEGFDIEDDVRVWIQDVEIVRDFHVTNNEIETIMYALSGCTVYTSAPFANRIYAILRKYIV